jgi:predicted ester cyclase
MLTVEKNPTLNLKSNAIAFMFAYQQQDIENMMRLCDTEGSVWFKPLGNDGRGTIGGLGKGLWTTLIDCFPNLDNTVNSAILDPNGQVRCQVDIRGTQAKEFAGIPSKGMSFETNHIFIFHHNPDGKIDSIEIEWNHADFQRQLGMI